ncbi:hypothetical protein BU16DRAFT_356398 [Lophium mytilinum]|uniref:F-box domain-containing protein n=1 Tax=Lophium mytilinum TaxID=390894 RepID=A0A6A6QUJ0_9PEZI|nr:hypothetical protein BU16DRAFT_356398 [Lophium mytilinum]
MACLLPGLADELQLLIIDAIHDLDALDNPDSQSCPKTLLNLSTTCLQYRALLRLKLFDTATLRNTIISAASIHALAASEYAENVRHIQFKGSIDIRKFSAAMDDVICSRGGSIDVDEYQRAAAAVLLPRQVHDILSNLGLFANLDTLTVCFDVGLTWWPQHPQLHLLLEEEKTHHWMILFKKTAEALATNQQHQITTLRLLEVVPTPHCSSSNTLYSTAGRFFESIESLYVTFKKDVSQGCDLDTSYPRHFRISMFEFFSGYLQAGKHVRFGQKEWRVDSDGQNKVDIFNSIVDLSLLMW